VQANNRHIELSLKIRYGAQAQTPTKSPVMACRMLIIIS